jgi:hypothetical protein
MSNYTQITDFSVKDNLASGDAAKVIKGSDIDAELSAISTAIATKGEGGDVPSGSAMVFFQTAAPTGWTKSTANNDKALRVVSGDGGGTGGSVAFETALASHTVSISGTSGATTLVEAQTPIHNHDIRGPMVASGGAQYSAGNTSGTGSGNYGGGGSHTHSFSDTYALNLDVQYINVIVCTKD